MNNNTDTTEYNTAFKEASQEELVFINHHMPRGMVAMIMFSTKKSRSKVEYQLSARAIKQDPDIIEATRRIFEAVTQISFNDEYKKRV